jgi:HTH-type transcriptional regulator/antitoxin HipB
MRKRAMVNIVRSPKSLGATLRRHRRQLKLTQAELAARAGIRQGTVSQVENGLETVKLQTLMHLLRALDLEITVQPRTKGSHSEIEQLF